MKNTQTITRRSRRRQQGATLLEMAIAVLLMSLIFIGAMNLFVQTSRTSASVNAKIVTGQDAANGLQRIIEEVREARWIALPDERDASNSVMFAGRPGYAASTSYKTTYNARTVHTAVLLVFPKDMANTAVNTSTGTYQFSGGQALYDRGADGEKLLIYRSTATGVPDPAAGSCLWAYSLHDNGQTANRAWIKTVATAANAVQFARPVDNQGNALPYQLEVKIVSGQYSPVKGVQTSEAGNGRQVTALTGKCVQLRNHEQARDHNPLAGGVAEPWMPN